uniref:Uncharacterized protein n=1 Tax=Romanomermis culicivorax TaxID=13658 RepID=A0A915HPQ1_ROMCU
MVDEVITPRTVFPQMRKKNLGHDLISYYFLMDVPTGGDQAAENPNQIDLNRQDGTTIAAAESTSNSNVNAANNILNINPPAPNTNIRDRLFHLIFVRATTAYSRIVPEHLRRIIEFFLLLKALFFLVILLYVHISFSRITPTCLSDLKQLTPKDGVFRLQVFKTDDDVDYLKRQSSNSDDENKLVVNSKVGVVVNVTSNNRLIVLNVDAMKFLNDHHLRMIDDENPGQDERTPLLKYDLIRFLLPNRTDGATGTILIDKEDYDENQDENVQDVDR